MGSELADTVDALRAAWPQVRLELREDPPGTWRLDLIRVADTDRGQGHASGALAALCAAADEAGARVACSPATDWGATRSGLERLYRRAGFRPNTGPGRDLEVRETMLREPQPGTAR